MGLVEFATNPWGQTVPIHIFFYLMWVAAIGGLGFLMVHAIYVQFVGAKQAHVAKIDPALAAKYPAKIPRHSLVARLFHWVMSVAMFALLITAFVPRMGYPFDWVTYHWIAGLVLTASIIFHIFHATFWMDFWSIWPDKEDIQEAKWRFLRATGKDAPEPRKFGKYPFENKMYHLIIVLSGLAVTLTGVFMMKRVRTPFFVRNPYLFSDMTWGLMYVLHGLAGVGLIGLVMVHVYFALRPEKFVITESMIGGSMDRDFYLEHYDQERWKVPAAK